MISFKLTIFLLIAMAYVMVIRAEDDTEGQKTSETKGLFDDLKLKVSNTFDNAVEKSKETFKMTEDELSNQFSSLKEKGKELFKDGSENPESIE